MPVICNSRYASSLRIHSGRNKLTEPLPLAIFPSVGSELYRGLGVVVVGGLFTSAFLTLLTVPAE